MALSDVLKPKSKDELAKSIIDYYEKNKKENNDQWCVNHILKENTMGDEFVKEVKNLIHNDMKSKPEDVLLITSSSNIFKPFMTYLAEDKNESIKGTLEWNYKLFENSIVHATSTSRAEAILIPIKTFKKL